MLLNKRILLIISGGVAAYKSLELIRRLREQGADVRVIMTRAACEFITPLSVSSLAGGKVSLDLFDPGDEGEMGHIELSRDADLLVVAPATAHIMARMAAGLCDDLATTCLLATDKPVLLAPAMNMRMWQHRATRRNLETLTGDGIAFVGPDEGDMACGEFGPGRMAEPDDILKAVIAHFSDPADRPLAGRRVLVTAGPTHEPIDPVRYIANRSSGKQGYAIAAAAARAGARTMLVTGPSAEPRPAGVEVAEVRTADEMHAACLARLPCDVAIMAAAVADWKVVRASAGKIKKTPGKGPPALKLEANADILQAVGGAGANRPGLVVGFAAETGRVVENARAKLKSKGCDWILANDVSPRAGTFGGQDNQVTLVSGDGVEPWPRLSKRAVAERLVARIAEHVSRQVSAAE